MKKLFKLVMIFVCFSNLWAQEQQSDKQAAPKGLPPLIDRQLLFGDPEIAGSELSPDGKYLAFLKPWKDTRNIWVKKTEDPFGSAKLLTTETKRPVGGFFWSRDSKYILYVKDTDGDENFNVYAVDPAATAESGADAPSSRDLTKLKGVQVHLYSLPKSDPDTAYVGLNDRDKAWHDLYKLRISTGDRTLVRKNTEKISDWFFDLKGQLRLAVHVADNGDTEILRVDADGFKKVYTCTVFETCDPLRFHKDGKHVYMMTNKGDNTDLVGLVLLDPATGKTEPVESDPLKKNDFAFATFSEVTDELVATEYSDDHVRIYFRDKAFGEDYEWLRRKLGNDVHLNSRTLDDHLWLISHTSDIEPGAVYLFDRKTRMVSAQYRIHEKLPRAALSSMQTVEYKSSDGLTIPAYLVLPKGVEPKNLPVVIMPHGGPWSRNGWGYNPSAQFLANRGYAVLEPNFRGSTGYGKKFLNAGNGEWGRKMQDDITWGVQYLVSQGIADAKRVGIMGGSYGGYAVLAGVTFTPDVYRAGVDIVGPSELASLLESIPPYWEAARKVLYSRVADPSTETGKALLKERSPFYYVDNIKTPLMVVQGANDPRVNRSQAERIVIALRDHNLPVEYLLAPDEGHGFARPVNNMAMYMAAEKFLAQQLGGRYQQDGTPEVVARLKEITVDPATVVLVKKADTATTVTPKPVMDLHAATYKYKGRIALMGREIDISLITTIADDNGSWIASDAMSSNMGDGSDIATLDKGTLLLHKRVFKQGPATMDLSFSDNKATGTMNVNGQETPISIDLGGPLFADAAGGALSIGCLPLAEGYTATYRNFDLLKQKPKVVTLLVSGSEKITVAAGTFDAFKVDLSSADDADKETVWIAKDTHTPVKVLITLSQMGGAVLTEELQP